MTGRLRVLSDNDYSGDPDGLVSSRTTRWRRRSTWSA